MIKDGLGFRSALFGWNIFGALDLLVAVGTAGWLNAVHPGSMREIAGFPLVPVFLSSHFYLIRRQAGRSFAPEGNPVGALQ